MKHFTFQTCTLSLGMLFLTTFLSAQSTILEQDGASNEFVVSDWTIDSPCFANTNQVNICNSKSGILQITNSNSYKNLTVELHFSQTNTISFNMDLMVASTGILSKTGLISDNTGSPNKIIVSYNNATALMLNKLKFYSPNMNTGITYLKITGDLSGGTTSIEENIENNISINAQANNLLINLPSDYHLAMYSSNGQLLGNYDLKSGNNTVECSYKGLLFLVVSDQNNMVVARKKLMH